MVSTFRYGYSGRVVDCAGAAAERAVIGTTKEKVQLIKDTVCAQQHLSCQQQEQLRNVLIRHHEAMSLGKSDMGRSSAVPHILRPKTDEPAYMKQFPIPAVHLHFINEQIDKLLALWVIKEDWVSPHNSTIFAVKKPHSEELRFVIDMRKVNEIFWDDFHLFMYVMSPVVSNVSGGGGGGGGI